MNKYLCWDAEDGSQDEAREVEDMTHKRAAMAHHMHLDATTDDPREERLIAVKLVGGEKILHYSTTCEWEPHVDAEQVHPYTCVVCSSLFFQHHPPTPPPEGKCAGCRLAAQEAAAKETP